MESTISMVNDIGSLFSRSITFRNILLSEIDTLKFKSMCPTRWTVRLKEITNFLNNYIIIKDGLINLQK